MKLYTASHFIPREYQLPELLRTDLGEGIKYFAVSETGKFIFATSDKVICIYNCEKNKTIYRYENEDVNN